jgi:Hypoxia induced protein conserved region
MSSTSLTNSIVLIAVIAVAIVLVLGLFNMLRGGSPNLSQKLMRWRVGLQFVAILVIMAVLWWRGG